MPRRRKTASDNPFINDARWFLGLLAAILLIWLPPILKILVALTVLAAIYGFWRTHEQRMRALRQAGIEEIDEMTGAQFEEKVWALFKQLGYRVTPTPRTGDFGADHILVKDGVRIAVQAKRYRNPVGVEHIYPVISSLRTYGCDQAIVVTNSTFTGPARQAAEHNAVELWDRNRLIAELVRAATVK